MQTLIFFPTTSFNTSFEDLHLDLKKQWTWVPLDSSCGDGNAPATDP
jgi:hypothetical protein